MASPYMNLALPTPSVTAGPAWAAALNTVLTAIDAHDHSPGFGRQVRTSGLSIDAALSFAGFDATNLRSARLVNQGSPLAVGTDVGCLYQSGGNLFWNNASGQQIQITAGAALNAASIGAIGGDYSTSTASEVYLSASQTFQFFQASNKYANLDAGNVTLREPGVTSPHGIALKSPTGLAADYGLTLPAALPASTKILTVSSAGAVGAVYDVDGATLEVASNALRVKDGGITAVKTDAVSAPTASRLVVRDASGRAQFADPSASQDAVTLAFLDAAPPAALLGSAGTGWTDAGTNFVLAKDRTGRVTRMSGWLRHNGGNGAADTTLGTFPVGGFVPFRTTTVLVPFKMTGGTVWSSISVQINTSGVITSLSAATFDTGDLVYFDGVTFANQ